MLEFMDHASDQRRRGLRCDGPGPHGGGAAAGQSDAPAAARRRDRERWPRCSPKHGATEVFATDDPDEGEAFAAARRSVFPAVEAWAALLLEDVGVPMQALPRLVTGVERDRRGRDVLISRRRARRRRQHASADRLSTPPTPTSPTAPTRLRRDHGPGDRAWAARSPASTASGDSRGRGWPAAGPRGDGAEPADQERAGSAGHPEPRLGNLTAGLKASLVLLLRRAC